MGGSLKDYIEWRGDISLSGAELNEADNFVLCQLAYADLGRHYREGQSLADNLGGLLSSEGPYYKLVFETDEDRALLGAAAASERFGRLRLLRFSEVLDGEKSTQFAAVTFDLGDRVFTAIRGTDCTLMGWKENFMLGFREVGAQKLALEYLRRELLSGRRVVLGGHSKGANLALYAAAMLEKELQSGLLFVYLNDGPGLCPQVLPPELTAGVSEKCLVLRPEYSVVGGLFNSGTLREKRVKSSAAGPFQHALVTWEVGALGAVEAAGGDENAAALCDSMNNALDKLDMKSRESYIDSIFSLITNRKNALLSDFRGLSSFERAAGRLFEIGERTAASARDDSADKGQLERLRLILKGVSKYIGAALAVIGALCCLFPPAAPVAVASFSAAALLAAQVMICVRALKKSGWSFSRERTRLAILACSIVLYCALMLGSGGTAVFTEAFCGVLLCAAAFASVRRAFRRISAVCAARGVFCLALGAWFLSGTRGGAVFPGAVLGLFLVCEGIWRTASYFSRNRAELFG